MLFVGAGGLAAQLFEDLVASRLQNVTFWSETETPHDYIKKHYPIISTDEEVIEYFTTVTTSFVLCIGDIKQRKKVTERFIALGGKPSAFLSPFCRISPYIKSIGNANIILNDAEMEADVIIEDNCLLNKKSKYGHGCIIRSNCEVGPMATISAYADIGEESLIGINSLILPNVKIGRNVTVSAGSVITKNIPDNAVVAGNPAVIRFYKKV